MAVTHANKALALGLVDQQVGVDHYEGLLKKMRSLHNSKVEISINMGWTSFPKSINNIVHCI